jgi:hypothetical protein
MMSSREGYSVFTPEKYSHENNHDPYSSLVDLSTSRYAYCGHLNSTGGGFVRRALWSPPRRADSYRALGGLVCWRRILHLSTVEVAGAFSEVR